MKQIAVLMTVFNRCEVTLSCLRRLYAQILPHDCELDTFIIDGGSSDGTVQAVERMFPGAHIRVENNVFWNRGMWHAWEWASSIVKGDDAYYLWLNDDTFLIDGAVESLMASSARHDDKAIIVGATVNSIDNRVQTYGGRIKGHLAPLEAADCKVDCFNGNIVLVPAFVYSVLGNLDYYFTHSKGDYDYGYRARESGVLMFQVGVALGVCDKHESLDRWCDPRVPLRERWRALSLPNGMPPKESFYFEKRHRGVLVAIIHYFSIHFRCVFPSLWKNHR